MDFNYTKRIYGYECDIYGHLNNANYLPILEAARSEALQVIEMPIQKLLELDWLMLVRKVEMEFLKSVELEDMIEVRSQIVEMNKLRSTWHQEIYNSKGELCFTARLGIVHVHEGKPARVPDEIFSHFLRFIQPQ
jgi:YbgC/YbaW family acyl-CoA thioester hydrolase